MVTIVVIGRTLVRVPTVAGDGSSVTKPTHTTLWNTHDHAAHSSHGAEMSSTYYYDPDGRRFGPVSAQALKALADAGKLRPTDLIWKAGTLRSRPAAELKGLFPAPAPAAVESPAVATAVAAPVAAP